MESDINMDGLYYINRFEVWLFDEGYWVIDKENIIVKN